MTVLYGSNVADTTLTTACKMSTVTGGTETTANSSWPNASGTSAFAELFSQGTANGTTTGPIPAPTGHGWIYFPGAGTFATANWSASVKADTTGANASGVWTIRFYKYSAGVYTSIGSITATITATGIATYSFAATSMSSVTTGASDGIYVDFWYQDTTGAQFENVSVYVSSSATAGVASDMQVTTSTFTPAAAAPTIKPRYITRGLLSTIIPIVVSQPLPYIDRGMLATIVYEDRTFIPRAFSGVYIPDTVLWVPRAFGGTISQALAPTTTYAFTDALIATDSLLVTKIALPVDSLSASDATLSTDGTLPLDSLSASDIGNLQGWGVDGLTASDSLLMTDSALPVESLTASDTLLTTDGSLYTEANSASDSITGTDSGLLIESLATSDSLLEQETYIPLDALIATDSLLSEDRLSPYSVAATASDTFIRANQSGWGTASDSEVWSVVSGSAGNFSIASNEGQITGATSIQAAYLGTTMATDIEVLVRYTASAATADNVLVFLRSTASSTQYRIKQADASFSINRVVAGTHTVLQSATFTTTAAQAYWIRAVVVGGPASATLAAKTWQDGTAEPLTWNLSGVVDSSPITGAGQFGLACTLNVATDTVKFDTYTVAVYASPDALVASDIGNQQRWGIDALVASDSLLDGGAFVPLDALTGVSTPLDWDIYNPLDDNLIADDSASTMVSSSSGATTTTYSFVEALVASDSLLVTDSCIPLDALSASDTGNMTRGFIDALIATDSLLSAAAAIPIDALSASDSTLASDGAGMTDALSASDFGGMTRGFVEALVASDTFSRTDAYIPTEVQSVAESLLAGDSASWIDLLSASDSFSAVITSPQPPKFLTATWVTRDGLVAWITRDGKVTWATRDDKAAWDTRDDQASWDTRDDLAIWKTRG